MRVWIETSAPLEVSEPSTVTLYVRVWIETLNRKLMQLILEVTLYVRVWIETPTLIQTRAK